ncbi:MAG: hypothetical protein IH945_03580 [Armatimonadetes bacterium]|nr:hypothetical protein [Armatimonadota bacterium]
MCPAQWSASRTRTPGRARKLTPQEEAEMVADYHEHRGPVGTIKVVADWYGVSHQTVYNAVDRDQEAQKAEAERAGREAS